MRAIVIKEFGGLDGLVIEKLPDPVPQPGSVLIEVKAFGINHAENHMRRGEWAEAAKVIGIECVGLVKSCPGGEFAPGTKVAAFMGGMGRTINGSYAEYTCPPVTNVVPIKTDLPWEEFAVIPESYATAWTSLHRNLEIKPGQTLVIRGATSALGRAALNIAADAGAHIIATTRKKERFPTLLELGAHRTEIETPKLSQSIAEAKKIDAVLDLVGNTTFMDSLRMLRRGGRMCLAGWLGGLDPVNDFNPLLQMPSGVYFTFFASFAFGTPEFPVSDIPLQSIVDKVAAGVYKAKPARVFNSTISAPHTKPWNRTKPTARWWSGSEIKKK
jgi:NADPH:quinone reductase